MKDLFLLIPHNSVYTLTIHVCLMGSFVLGELGKCTKLQWLEAQSKEPLISDLLLAETMRGIQTFKDILK